MATATPVLERERTSERDLRAYGRIAGGVENTQEMTEEQKALRFNSRISENYQKLINPEYSRAEDFAAPAEQASAEDIFARGAFDSAPAFEQVPAYQAPAFQQAPVAERLSVQSPVFGQEARAAVYEAPAEAPVYTEQAYEQQAPAYAEEDADLMPTATTIQYRSDLFEDEKPVAAVEEKKRYALTSKGKLLMAVYALVVVVILALIIINTSVLKTLDGDVAEQEARLSETMSQSQAVKDDIDYYSSDEFIIEWAESNGYTRG